MQIAPRAKRLFRSDETRLEAVTLSVAALISLVLLVFVWTQPWAYRTTGDGLSIAVFPSVSLGGIIVFSLLCLIDLSRGVEMQDVLTEASSSIEEDIQWGPAIFLAIVGILSSFAVVRIDPLLLTGFMATLILVVARVRNWYLLVGTALGVPLFVYVFLVRLAGVFFPTSIF